MAASGGVRSLLRAREQQHVHVGVSAAAATLWSLLPRVGRASSSFCCEPWEKCRNSFHKASICVHSVSHTATQLCKCTFVDLTVSRPICRSISHIIWLVSHQQVRHSSRGVLHSNIGCVCTCIVQNMHQTMLFELALPLSLSLPPHLGIHEAVVRINARGITGTITFREVETGTKVIADLQGLQGWCLDM